MNLLNLAEKFAGEEPMPVAYEPGRCLHSKDKLARCNACIEVCPTEAVQAGRPPQFRADACVDCFACLPLCPIGAFASEDDLPSLLRCLARLDVETLELVCQHHTTAALGLAGKTAAIQVRGCLAGLGVAGFLQLATSSLSRVVVRLDACATCPWQTLPEQVKKQIEQTQDWLRTWQRADFVRGLANLDGSVKRPLHRADAPPVSRRDLFRGRVQEPPAVDITSGLNPFHRRLRTIRALQRLSTDATDPFVATPAESDFGTVVIDQTCSACGTCARACPSGALALQQDDEERRFQLMFFLQACLACSVCVHVCPEQALTLKHEMTLDQILDGPGDTILCEGTLETCRRCKGSFATQSMRDGYCSVCAFRQSNPFASHLPPALFSSDSSLGASMATSGEKK